MPCRSRRIYLPLKDKFDEIIDKWGEMDSIEDVRDGGMVQQCCSHPKERWRKHQGKPGHDVTKKCIKRTKHSIPTLGELETRLNKAKYFSHLDMNNGYMQLERPRKAVLKLATFSCIEG